MLDRMAQRYGKLPSQIMQDASTFDLVIMDMALTYEQYQRDRQDPNYVPEVDVETLMKIRERNQ